MTTWYRYAYTTANPDSFQARQRVYDASDTLRTGWSTLRTSVINLNAAQGQENLFFWYRFSLAANNMGPEDTLYIDISENETTWFNLMKIDNITAFNVWDTAQLSLAAFDNFSSAYLRFHYEDRPNGSLGGSNCNFWLDSVKVISYFTDTFPPVISSTSPAAGDTGVGVNSNITIFFNEAINPQTLNLQAINVVGQTSGTHTGGVTYDSLNFIAQFNPSTVFAYAETVFVTVYDSVTDLAGNRLDGDNNGTPGGDYNFLFFTASTPDTVAPAAVTNLAVVDTGADYVKLRWTAPGDDGNFGRASYYDVRYANFAITEANFLAATACMAEPPPSNAGQTDSFSVTGLFSNTQYYFALKTADEDSNWSVLSNVPACTTSASLETLLIINELLPDPQTFDHNNNGIYNDQDEEFIEIFNSALHNIDLQNFKIGDFIGSHSLTLPAGFVLPAFGYLLLYASGEGLIISGDCDTLHQANWLGTWPNLDQAGDTIILFDNLDRELDRKGYNAIDVVPDFSIARLPNGSETWINNAFPTPGQNNGTEYVWPIAVAFKDVDSNYVPDLMDSIVTITGVVTAPPGIYSNSEAYIQDNTGGVCLFGDFSLALDYGDSIIATGQVAQYRGKSELSNFTYQRLKQGCALPEPVVIDGNQANTEIYEGSLVKVKVFYIDGFLLEATSYTAWDSANTAFTIYIDSYTNIPGSLAPIDSFTLTGIKGQYSYNTVPNDGYQIMPRDTTDFSHMLVLPQQKSIAETQMPGGDGVTSYYLDSVVAVEGTVTGPNYVFSSGSPSFYIQDQTGGVNVYGADGDDAFLTGIDSVGARVRILGTVTEYNGLTEIANGYGWFIAMDSVPEPKELGSNRFLTEGMEGALLSVRGVIKTAPYKTGDGYNFEISNGDCGIAVRFTTNSAINPATLEKETQRDFTGIAGQYDPEAPYTSGYQLLLRSPDDIKTPDFDSASTAPMLEIVGNKTFIPGQGEQAHMKINSPFGYDLKLSVYDMSGKLLKQLYQGAGGPQEIFWDGRDEKANPCKIGIYLLNLKATNTQGKSEFRRQLMVIGTEF